MRLGTGKNWETLGNEASSAPQLHGLFLPGARDSWVEVPASVGPSWAWDLCTIRLRRSGAGRPIEPCLWQCGSRLELGPLAQVAGIMSLAIRGDVWMGPGRVVLVYHVPQSSGPGFPGHCRTRLSAHPGFQLLTPGAARPKGAGTGTVPSCFSGSTTTDSKAQHRPQGCSLPRAQQTVTGGKEQENHCRFQAGSGIKPWLEAE